MKRLILTLIIGIITMVSVNAQFTSDDLSGYFSYSAQQPKASITFSNQSGYTMVIKVLHIRGGLYSTVKLPPHTSSTVTFSATETFKTKIKATSANGGVSYHDGGKFSVTCTSTEWTEGTMSFRLSSYGSGLGPKISASEFESNY